MSQEDSNKAVLQELEFLRADLDLLRQEVDSIKVPMKQVRVLQAIMDMTLKDMLKNDYSALNTPI